MDPQEISVTIKLTAAMVNAIAHRVAEIQGPQTISKVDLTYTVKEVASMLDKTTTTITRHIRLDLLEAHKIGKSYIITQNNLKNYINAK